MFFGTGEPSCIDCTVHLGRWFCTRNCGPKVPRKPEEVATMSKHVESTSEDRTVNNTVRHQYRVLSEAEKLQMQEVKDIGAGLIAKLHEIGRPRDTAVAEPWTRDLQLAQDHVEYAVMRAVRHITR